MAAAERVVAPGGTIVMASECEDGLPAGGAFERLLAGARDADELLAGGAPAIGASAVGSASTPPAEPDGWQTQVLGRVLSKADVWLRSDGIDDASAELAQLRPVHDLDEAVEEALRRYGESARVCVLVRGPLAVATDIST
jgi:hypothetical protein